MFAKRLTLTLLGLALSAAALSASAARLDELADEADVVALVRVEQVDYEKTRDFPSSGSAFLEVLIPYKGEVEKGDWLEVKEKGLGDYACYYPEPDPFAFEGARFLVMLREDPKEKDIYRGVTPGCRIPVLVTQENRYAVRYPVQGLEIPEDKVEQMTFADPAAVVDATEYTSSQIEELENVYRAVRVETGPYEPNNLLYQYTHGVPIGEIRRLMDIDEAEEETATAATDSQ